ncbi:MAG: Fe-S cluster assembly ATPase SufC [Candidatus Diapherotrites archaeon]|nr:Fe-S cluster assembly ATPase SufC [Candidatus Diapherotrites archaeon]
MKDLVIEDLHVSIEGREILKGLSLQMNKGEVHALMGPNGSGKSTLAYALMGHPRYVVTQGCVTFLGEDLLRLSPDKRARLGLFLSFQYPQEVAGVSLANFLRMALSAVNGKQVSVPEFQKLLREKMALLKMDASFAGRYLNDGFSGGEKKRAEILQLAVLEPVFAVLDETDSGLDIDSLKIVAEGVNRLISPKRGVLVITHYQRLLNYIKPGFVHVMAQGRIIKSGGPELVHALEEKGYDWVLHEAGLKEPVQSPLH